MANLQCVVFRLSVVIACFSRLEDLATKALKFIFSFVSSHMFRKMPLPTKWPITHKASKAFFTIVYPTQMSAQMIFLTQSRSAQWTFV